MVHGPASELLMITMALHIHNHVFLEADHLEEAVGLLLPVCFIQMIV